MGTPRLHSTSELPFSPSAGQEMTPDRKKVLGLVSQVGSQVLHAIELVGVELCACCPNHHRSGWHFSWTRTLTEGEVLSPVDPDKARMKPESVPKQREQSLVVSCMATGPTPHLCCQESDTGTRPRPLANMPKPRSQDIAWSPHLRTGWPRRQLARQSRQPISKRCFLALQTG